MTLPIEETISKLGSCPRGTMLNSVVPDVEVRPLDVQSPTFTWVVPSDAASNIPYFCIPHCNFGQEGEIIVAD